MKAAAVLHGGMGVSPSAGESVNAEPIRKTAEIVGLRRRLQYLDGIQYARALRDVFSLIGVKNNPRPTHTDRCEFIGQLLGESDDTIARSVGDKTTRIDVRRFAAMCAIATQQGKDVTKVNGVPEVLQLCFGVTL